MLKVLRVLVVREDSKSVAVALDHFIVGEGANDKEAVDALAAQLKIHTDFGDYERTPPANAERFALYESLTRRTTTIRGDFLMHLRAAY